MQLPDALQGSRFEFKYVIEESRARAARDFALSYLEPDKHALNKPNHEYGICSLYLDSAEMALCRATVHGERNRFKLRIRFYEDSAEAPAYVEIKRRLDNVIRKQRTAVRREAIGRLLAGEMPAPSDLYEPRTGNFGPLEQFGGLASTIRAEGRLFVSYLRQAYVTPDDSSVRVTFDRQLTGSRYRGEPTLSEGQECVRPVVGGVILEIKFTNWFPTWLREMVRAFGLERRSMAKYVTCARELARLGVLIGWTHRPVGQEVRG
jgi:hypothetical protein